MFSLEFIQIFSYPASRKAIHLFRNRENGEGVMISSEIASLLEYQSLSKILVRDAHASHGIHYVLLQGVPLQEFKIYLQQANIPGYQKATRLLLVTETGICFLLSKHCKEKRIRIGEWLLYQILPKLRDYQSLFYYQKISSLYLQESLYLLIYQGRMGMLDFQLTEVLGLQPIDYVAYGCHGYVENVHVAAFPPNLYQRLIQEIQDFPSSQAQNSLYFFYESGIYRLLNKNSGPIASLLQKALEREIFPLFRQLGTHWIGIKEEEIRMLEKNQGKNNVLTSIMAETKQDWDILSERQRILGSLEKIQEKLMNFENKSSVVWNENRQKMEDMEKSHGLLKKDLMMQQQTLLKALEKLDELIAKLGAQTRQNNSFPEVLDPPSMKILKEICIKLGIYHLDKVTPNTVLMRALIDHVHSLETRDIEKFLQEKLFVVPGENIVWLKEIDYHFWKK